MIIIRIKSKISKGGVILILPITLYLYEVTYTISCKNGGFWRGLLEKIKFQTGVWCDLHLHNPSEDPKMTISYSKVTYSYLNVNCSGLKVTYSYPNRTLR